MTQPERLRRGHVTILPSGSRSHSSNIVLDRGGGLCHYYYPAVYPNVGYDVMSLPPLYPLLLFSFDFFELLFYLIAKLRLGIISPTIIASLRFPPPSPFPPFLFENLLFLPSLRSNFQFAFSFIILLYFSLVSPQLLEFEGTFHFSRTKGEGHVGLYSCQSHFIRSFSFEEKASFSLSASALWILIGYTPPFTKKTPSLLLIVVAS